MLVISGHSAGGQAEVDAPPPAQLQRPGLWIADTAFSPADIASVTLQWDTFSGEPNVLITFSETGRAKFERLQRGRVEQVLEISIDGTIVSSPVLREFISGGQVTISGGMTEAEAAALTRRLTPSRRY